MEKTHQLTYKDVKDYVDNKMIELKIEIPEQIKEDWDKMDPMFKLYVLKDLHEKRNEKKRNKYVRSDKFKEILYEKIKELEEEQK